MCDVNPTETTVDSARFYEMSRDILETFSHDHPWLSKTYSRELIDLFESGFKLGQRSNGSHVLPDKGSANELLTIWGKMCTDEGEYITPVDIKIITKFIEYIRS
jgi:hypothetical protein